MCDMARAPADKIAFLGLAQPTRDTGKKMLINWPKLAIGKLFHFESWQGSSELLLQCNVRVAARRVD